MNKLNKAVILGSNIFTALLNFIFFYKGPIVTRLVTDHSLQRL